MSPRKIIKGDHLAKGSPAGTTMMMLPAKDGTCEQCATKHEVEHAHNAQSLFYQYYFYNKHGRWPTWKDAIHHCTPALKKFWREHLIAAGVDFDAGIVNPVKS